MFKLLFAVIGGEILLRAYCKHLEKGTRHLEDSLEHYAQHMEMTHGPGWYNNPDL